jgi:hypothetical protein
MIFFNLLSFCLKNILKKIYISDDCENESMVVYILFPPSNISVKRKKNEEVAMDDSRGTRRYLAAKHTDGDN